MTTSSKQPFVEYFRRNIQCSPGRHIVFANHMIMYHAIVWDGGGGIADPNLTAVSTRELGNNDLWKTTDMYTLYKD